MLEFIKLQLASLKSKAPKGASDFMKSGTTATGFRSMSTAGGRRSRPVTGWTGPSGSGPLPAPLKIPGQVMIDREIVVVHDQLFRAPSRIRRRQARQADLLPYR